MKALSPTLIVEDPGQLSGFYARTFDARVHLDVGWYVVLHFGAHELALMKPTHAWQRALAPGSVTINLLVDDVDAAHAQLLARGASIEETPSDKPYGLRSFSFLDPAGACWYVYRPITAPGGDS